MRALKLLSAALFTLSSSFAMAQSFPSRQISIFVPFLPVGTNDIIARLVGAKMSESIGHPVVVDNKPGATGNVGANFVAKSAPDGYTILALSVGVLSINKWIYSNMQFDPDKDLAPITNAGSVPNMLLVHPSVPAGSVKELIAFAKAKPGALNFASQGTGSTGHLCGEMLNILAEVKTTHVPYKGSAPALNDLLGGQVQMMFDNLPTALPHMKSGKLRGLAVTSRTRHPLAPEVPTLEEAGLPGFEATAWFGFVAPGGTPRPILERLNAEIVKALRNPAVAERLTAAGVNIIANSIDEFAAFAAAESSKWRKVVQASGAKAD